MHNYCLYCRYGMSCMQCNRPTQRESTQNYAWNSFLTICADESGSLMRQGTHLSLASRKLNMAVFHTRQGSGHSCLQFADKVIRRPNRYSALLWKEGRNIFIRHWHSEEEHWHVFLNVLSFPSTTKSLFPAHKRGLIFTANLIGLLGGL
jgi:hypothetical protein